MNILIIAYRDIVGSLTSLARAVNENTSLHVDIISREIEPFGFPSDASGFFTDNKERHNQLIDNADVIHYCNLPIKAVKKELRIEDGHIELSHGHGSDLRKNDVIYNDSNYPFIVSTPDLLQFVEKSSHSIWMPNIFNIGKISLEDKYDIPTICHTPSSRQRILDYLSLIDMKNYRDYGYEGNINYCLKHTDFFRGACISAGFNYDIIEGVNIDKCIRKKAKSHLYFDQIFLGAYGMALVEALALGIPGLCRVSPICMKAYHGASIFPCPIINVDEKNFIPTVKKLIEEEAWNVIGEQGRRWVEDVHGPKNVSKKYIEFIETISRR